MIKRLLEEKVKYFSEKYPVVTITGPRQSGKTTLVQNVFVGHEYISLENPESRRNIIEDPSILFFPEGRKIIIDEVQKIPELLSYIQIHADKQKINGQFILTGSQNLLMSEKISQTLAGRTALIKLLPFSLNELRSVISIDDENYESIIYRGFYPRIYDADLKPDEFYPFYIETYLQRDIREIQQVRDLDQFSNFIRLCAGRIGQLLDLTSLSNDAGISVNTVKGWLSILQASYIVILLQPFYKNLNRRIIKSPKLYFLDTGLASFLLNISQPNQIANHYLKGNLFENMIIIELLKKRFNDVRQNNLWFFRDSHGNEVDCIIEDLNIRSLEIKSSRTFSPNFISGLEKFSRIADVQDQEGFVIYGGEENFNFKNFNILSWRNLDSLI